MHIKDINYRHIRVNYIFTQYYVADRARFSI